MSQDFAPHSVVTPGARIGPGVTVGHGTIIYEQVEIGEGTKIDEHCVIGLPAGDEVGPLRIGRDSHIRSHAVCYQGAELGDALETGHHVVIRSGARAGENLRLGSFSSLEGDLTIGDYVRIHGYTQVGRGSQIGDFAWIFSLCTLTNDPLPPSDLFRPVSIGAGAVICVGATLMPGCRVGRGAFVAAGARVADTVPDATVLAADGHLAGPIDRLMNLESGVSHPWLRHFTAGYPPSAHARLSQLRDEILGACARGFAS